MWASYTTVGLITLQWVSVGHITGHALPYLYRKLVMHCWSPCMVTLVVALPCDLVVCLVDLSDHFAF